MNSIKNLLSEDKCLAFKQKWLENVRLTTPPLFCPICGAQKSEFRTPESFRFWDGKKYYTREPHIIILDCACERDLKTLKEVYQAYLMCRINKNSYADFIDGIIMAKSDDEIEIMRTGLKMRSAIQETERKTRGAI